jgi:hypothetical protein
VLVPVQRSDLPDQVDEPGPVDTIGSRAEYVGADLDDYSHGV